MAFSFFRKSPGPGDGIRKALTRTLMASAAAGLLVPLLISSQAVPQPSARLEPARLAVSLAHDAAPVDLTTTLSNTGAAPLAWRVGAIRDVTAETAPAVASGPVSAAKLYAKANLAHETSSGEIIVGLKSAGDAGASALATAPSSFLGGRCKVKKELAVRARRNKGGKALKLRSGRKLLLVSVEDKSKAGMQKAIEDLRKDPTVAYAEPNFRLKAVGMPDDPDFGLLYGLHNEGQTGGLVDADIDAPEAWDIHTGTGEVVVGIIDTGIDYLHPDLVDNVWTNPGEIPGNGADDDGNGYIDDIHGYDFVNDDADPMDDHYHGTHVAGTIAGRGNNGAGVTGVAWKAKVAGLKFLDAGGGGNLDDAIEAVAYANAMNIPITNNSWGGGGFSQALKDVIDAAGERGFLFVAAAGNASNDNDAFPSYPSSYESDNIIAVAATDHVDGMAFFSSFGATTVDLGAPGVDIWSCRPGNQYQFLSGTSMATPHVAGAAALLKSYNPQLSGAEIKAALLNGVDPIPALAGRTLTGGRLNLAKALEGVNPPWLTVAPRGPGSLDAGASQVLTATVDPRGLTAGEHRGIVSIPTNDPNKPDQELEVVATVSGCKSLVAVPTELDFGGVWRTTTKRMTVTLRNACNDFTTLTAVESPSGEFAALAPMPLRVPPFGSVAIEIGYSPAGLGSDEAVLTVRSDAADHPALALAVRGSGVEPPAIAAAPSSFALTLDPDQRAVRTLTVSNPGGDDLIVDLKTARPAAPAAKAGPAPRLLSGKGVGAPWSAPLAPSGKAPSLKPAFHASASGLKVLYVTTLLGPGMDDQFTTGLRGLGNVGSLDVLNGGFSVPNVDYLKAYDVVIVASNQPWADAQALGDALADYVDQGGTTALLTAAIAGGGGYSLRGRIVEPEYMPIDMQGPGAGGDAVDFEDHPITQGVKLVSCRLPTAATKTRGKGESLGRYPSGSLIGAVNPDKAVVAINVFPADFSWGGDFILLMGNTLDYLSGAASWLKVQPRHAVIPAGGSADFTLEISAEGQFAGDHPSGVEISHNAPNAPNGANPLIVPVLLHVNPVSHLSLTPAKHDFGSILLGNSAEATVTLVNTGNQATTVSGIAAEGDFRSAVPAPITVPAFGEAVVGIRYVPSAEGGDVGGLTFASDASDHPSLRIALRGTCLPAPLAALAPERLAVSLAYNAPPRDLTSTLSNGGRGILHWQVATVKDVTPSKAVSKALAVQAERIYQASNYDLPAVPGELLVGFKEGTQGLANAAALGNGLTVKRFLGRAKAPKNRAAATAAWKMPRKIAVVSLADGSKAGVQKAIAALRNDANVAYAEPNFIWKAVGTPNDPEYPKLWGMHNVGQSGGVSDADIDAPEAWDVHTGDENGVVGVIDTGIDWLHPDLAANVWTNPGEIAGNGIDDDANGFIDDVHGYDFVNEDGDPMDDHFHGTHCAGTIAGVGDNGQGVAGVSWKARVAGLKFLSAGGSGSTDDAVEAVAYANAMDIPITSNSWGGGGFSQALKDVIDAAGARGFLFIAAAGNSGSDNDAFPNFPSNIESENIIAVAATDHTDALAFFSCFGATTVDLGAPGVDVFSLAPGNQYQFLSGTSMATPHVAGAATLLRSYNPTLTGSEIKAALLASVDPIPALDGKTVTGGRLNIAKALGGVSPPWLVVNPRAPGVLQPGASQAITATVDPAGLVAGEHLGIATLKTDDPAHPTLQLEVVATVSGCKSLAVSPASLDHGSVWLGQSRRLSLLLTNKCNDVTTLKSVESTHKAFKAVSALPLAVAPFGSAVVEIEYIPDDLKADKATLTLKSDAQDSPSLKVQDKGTGVKPPSIAVDPAKVTLTLDPSEQKRSALKVTNKGGADLLVSLKVKAEKPVLKAPAPKLTSSDRKGGKRYGSSLGDKALKPLRIHPLVRATAADLKVLYLTTLWQPEGGDMFSQAVRGLPQVASLDLLDGGINVPNADYLKAYDLIFVSADFPWADAFATGDALADYVDDGGRVVLMVAATAAGGGYEIQGRIGSPEYMPIEKQGPGFGGIATSFADHPITAGLVSVECALPTAASAVQGGALALGQYESGFLLGAVHAEKAVVALNVFPSDFAWAGDFILMVSNTIDFLDGFSAWVKPEVATLTVPAGKTVETGLLFDTEGLEAGAYTASLSLAHNAPAGANPVVVPVSLTVKAKACLEAAPMAVDFGKVWSGRTASAAVELSNPCNRPTTIRTLTASPKVFKTGTTAPLVLAPFSKATVMLTYAPDGIKTDKGELLVKSDAQDHPQIKVALSGAGVKPPSISVKPTALAVTLDPGVKADKTVEITNAGGDSLRVKVSTRSADDAAKPKGRLIAGKPSTVRPLVGEARAPLAFAMPRRTGSRAAGLKVLYINTLWHPDSSVEDQFTQALRQLPSVSTVELLDATWQTPDAAYLLGYDAVIVASDISFSDAWTLGNNLADYVDAGGKLLLMANAFYETSPWGLDGRIVDPAYMPIGRSWVNWDGLDPVLADHPINDGVTTFNSVIHIGTTWTQGNGVPLGNYSNGNLTGAANPDKPIAALNVFPADGFWGGDVMIMVDNALKWLGGSVRWMKPVEREIVVAPGKTRKLTLSFNTEGMAAATHKGFLVLEHNAPAGANPLDVPVTLKVNAKRCLAVEPKSLDFGETWKDATAELGYTLVNKCNEPVKVDRIKSGDAAFTTVVPPLPLMVPAFGNAGFGVRFSPKDTKAHKANLEFSSNAQDNPKLNLALAGRGIKPPEITVTPASFRESAKAGEVLTRSLTVKNAGGAPLDVRFSVEDGAGNGSVPPPRNPHCRKGFSKSSVTPWTSRGAAISSFKRASVPSAKASGLRVLYFNTVVPDSATDNFVEGLRGLPQVASVELLNGSYYTPDADYLAGYDAVVVASSWSFADADGAGNALADYVDRGGKVAILTAAISNWPGLGIGGRFATPEYMPMTMEGPAKGGAVVAFENHPINEGISFLLSWYPTLSASVQGEGLPLGTLEGGSLLGAYMPRKAVVALNVFPTDFGWSGDLIPMMGNILDHLDGFGAWLKADPRNLIVPAGGSAKATVILDASRTTGGVHDARLILSHNVPGKPSVTVPVNLTVAGIKALALSGAALPFGEVLLGNAQSLDLVLSNSGNLPLTVKSVQTGSLDFSFSGATFPLELGAGERVRLSVTYAPSVHGDAAATLAFEATGAAAVRATLSGRGLRPADFRAATVPAPLRFTVVAGASASGSLRLSNAGDENLLYMAEVRAASNAAAVKAAAASAAYAPVHHAKLQKGSLDTRVGRPVDLASGGPDAQGHRWFDSDMPGGPAYAWTDISGTGRLLETVSSCDDCSEEVSLSFGFPFYRSSGYPSLFVSSNGYVTFAEGSSEFSNHPVPSTSMPGNLVAALFQDLYPAGGGSIFFQDYGNRAVIQYKAVPDFLGTGTYDFQIVLFADGTVDLLYKSLTGVKNTATVGIQNASADDGLGVAYNADYLHDGLAVRLRTWVTVPARFGAINGLDSKTLPVSLDSRGLAPGTYTGSLYLTSGASRALPAVDVPVELIVTPAPAGAKR